MRADDRAAVRTSRILLGLAIVFCAMATVRTALVESERLWLVVVAGSLVTVTLPTALWQAVLGRRSAAAGIAAAVAVLAPLPWVAPLWVSLVELLAALSAVALPARLRVPGWVGLAAVVAAGAARGPAYLPPQYLIGTALLTAAVVLPVHLLRARERRADLREELLTSAVRVARRERSSAVAAQLHVLGEVANPHRLADGVRAVHAAVRRAVRESEAGAAAPLPPTWFMRRPAAYLAACAVAPAVAGAALSALDLPGAAPTTPARGVVGLVVALVLMGAWVRTVLPGGRSTGRRWWGVLATWALVVVGFATGGETWAIAAIVPLATMLVVAGRRGRLVSIALAAGWFVVLPPVVVLVSGVPAGESVGVGLIGLPGLVLTLSLAEAPRVLTTTAEAERIESLLFERRRRADADRLAGEAHDLLGQRLSAAALHADLGDVETARGLVRAARDEALGLASGRPCLSLSDEVDAAVSVLGSAGAHVDLRVRDGLAPAPSDEILAWVLREAVANVLRHSSPTRVVVELTASRQETVLVVANDGVSGSPTARQDVGGLRLVRERLTTLGGSLDVDARQGAFELRAALPQLALTETSSP